MPKQRLVIDNFLGGLAHSRYAGNQTQMDPANTEGWDVLAQDEENVLQRGYGTSALANASVAGGIHYWMATVSRSAGQYLYALGENSGGTADVLDRIDIAAETLTNASPWPHQTAGTGNTGLGLAVYNGFLYYATQAYLGRYNFSLTFNDSYNFSLTSTAYGSAIDHPMVQGNGKLFIGNAFANASGGACVATLSGEVMNLTALDLSKTDKVVKALEFNGNHLFIAMSGNFTSTNTVAECSLVVWDTVSGSWQYEYRFPDNDFKAMKAVNGTLYCWGNRGFYRFNGGSFDLIMPILGGPAAGGVDVSPRGLLFFKDGDKNVYQYGTTNPSIPPILLKPINDASTQNAALKVATKDAIYVGASDASGGQIRLFTNGGTGRATTGEYRTPLMHLGQRVKIVKIYVVSEALPTGCELSFYLMDDLGKSVSCGTWADAGETSYEYQPNGADFETFQFRMLHTANTASPKIRKIVLEYEFLKE